MEVQTQVFFFSFFEIRLPENGEPVVLGQIFERERMVSEIILRKDGREYLIDSQFASQSVNFREPEKPPTKEDVKRDLGDLCWFIERHSERFSSFPSSA